MDFLSYLFLLFLGVAVTSTYADDTDDEPILIRVNVEHHTQVPRRRRSVDHSKAGMEYFDFPEQLRFSFRFNDKLINLDLTKSMYTKSEFVFEHGDKTTMMDFSDRIAVYSSVEQAAAVLVECNRYFCQLQGTIDIDGQTYNIEFDSKASTVSTDKHVHILRKKEAIDMEEFQKSIFVKRHEDTDIETSTTTELGHPRYRRTSIPKCDIFELKLYIDNTIWLFFRDLAGGDDDAATELIWKYYTGLVAETSSWTDHNNIRFTFNFADGKTGLFADGLKALQKCGDLHRNDPNKDDFDLLICLTSLKAGGTGSCPGIYIARENIDQVPAEPAEWRLNWFISRCTVTEICNFVKSLNAGNNCLRRHSFSSEEYQNATSVELLGVHLSADDQCRLKWGANSSQCDPNGNGEIYPSDMCARSIYCVTAAGCVCPVRVFSGTPCGYAKANQDLGEKCICHSQCTTDNAHCDEDTGECVCDDDYYDTNGVDVDGGNCTMKVCIGEPCNTTEQCFGGNVTCNTTSGICECTFTYFVNYVGQCIKYPGVLNDPCDPSPDSCTQDGTQCGDDGVCECADYVEIDRECFGENLCDPCNSSSSETCGAGLICSGAKGTCQCAAGTVQINNACFGENLCDPCNSSSSETCGAGLTCSGAEGTCQCAAGTVQINNACFGENLCDPCNSSSSETCGAGLICSGAEGTCQCAAGTVQINNACFGENLCDPCNSSSSETCGAGLTCSGAEGTCQCAAGTVQINNACYGTRYGENCTLQLDTCIDDNAECNATNNTCDCVAGFTWDSFDSCVGENLCDPCNSSSSETCGAGLTCSGAEGTCQCAAGTVQINNACLEDKRKRNVECVQGLTLIGGICCKI
ncbi:negative regulation of cellular response to hepatocyte growth factor stimulus [Mactra antiquata]